MKQLLLNLELQAKKLIKQYFWFNNSIWLFSILFQQNYSIKGHKRAVLPPKGKIHLVSCCNVELDEGWRKPESHFILVCLLTNLTKITLRQNVFMMLLVQNELLGIVFISINCTHMMHYVHNFLLPQFFPIQYVRIIKKLFCLVCKKALTSLE